jgi:hypothetical protein
VVEMTQKRAKKKKKKKNVRTHVTTMQSALPDHTATSPSSTITERSSIRADQDKDSFEDYEEDPIDCISPAIEESRDMQIISH